jgi:mycothiol synthase
LTRISPPITEGRLAAEQATRVLELAAAAARVDGVWPLSEDVSLQVRHGSGALARDLLLTGPDGVLAGYAHLDAPDDEAGGDEAGGDEAGGDEAGGDEAGGGEGGDVSGELVVDPDYRHRGYGSALVASLLAGADGQGLRHGIRLWAHGDLPAAAALAESAGFVRFRALLRLRMPLAGIPDGDPAFPDGVSVRTFRPGADEEAWLAVNRRAFAHHPEQGSWTLADLLLREAEPWFDPDGFFLAERDGQLAGFHWTKVHPAGGDDGAPIGEVYVVGVDPGQQGGGLGRALTLVGLAHLRRTGLSEVMLYVDESNTAAVRMYTGLGFTLWSTDVMYRRSRSS